MDGQPVAGANAFTLHALDPANPGSKLWNHQAIVGGLGSKAANGAHADVDCGGSQDLCDEMRPVRLNGCLREAGDGVGCRAPFQKIGDGPVVGSFALGAVDGIEYQRLEPFDGVRGRVRNGSRERFQVRPVWPLGRRITIGY